MDNYLLELLQQNNEEIEFLNSKKTASGDVVVTRTIIEIEDEVEKVTWFDEENKKEQEEIKE